MMMTMMNSSNSNNSSVATARYDRYPAYRDSGVAWLGEAPAHWEVKRLKFSIDSNPLPSELGHLPGNTEVSFVPMEAIGEYGGVDVSLTKTLVDVKAGYTYFREGDVVIAKITPCFENGKGALAEGLTNGIAFGTTELHVLRANQELSKEFLFYVSIGHAFRNLGEAEMYGAGGQKRVPESFIENFRQPLPPLPEQRAIAAFLDRETTRIDALIAKKERLIELLQEKRAAVITQAVTKGLDPSVPMKDSGVEWLGKVPAHWEAIRLGRLFRQAKRQGHPEETVLSVYRDFGVIEKSTRDDNHNRTPVDLNLYQLVRKDDLVVNKMKAWQGSLGVSTLDGITSPDYIVYTPTHSANPLYLHHLLRNKMLANVYLAISNGIRPDQWRLEPEKFEMLTVFLPSYEEQEQIVKLVKQTTTRIDAIGEALIDAVQVLREFRSTLISAAVTGKIDVREG